ncbi:MAG: Lpg1974 family pore-forming outer membrane protein [Gemmataceae bacterium]
MRGKTFLWKWLLAAVLALTPGLASAQQYAPADPQVPLPLGSTRPEDGGFYTYAGALLYRQSNPMKSQPVAIRGLYAYDTGGREQLALIPITLGVNAFGEIVGRLPGDQPDLRFDTSNVIPGGANSATLVVNGLQQFVTASPPSSTLQQAFVLRPTIISTGGLFESQGFVGSADLALDTAQLNTRAPYQPGMELGVGWKFRDGSAVTLSWKYLTETQYRAGATLAPPAGFNPPGTNPGLLLENTFLFSPVYNFPVEYAGADFKARPIPGTIGPDGEIVTVNPQTIFGLWNGASMMTISFRQWFQQYEICYREPVWETETYRLNGIVGPRYAWFWEKFKWVTTSIGQDLDGTVLTGPQFVGIYSNIVSNRMYGLFGGCEQEWYLGRGFALTLKTDAALFIDSAKEKAKYEMGAKYLNLPQNKRAQIQWKLVPEFEAELGMMWYPTEFVQIYAGYTGMVFMNTAAARHPIDFDYSSINPRYSNYTRWLDGWRAGIALTF